MRDIEGTATIPLYELDELRKKEERLTQLQLAIKSVFMGYITEDYWKEMKEVTCESICRKNIDERKKEEKKKELEARKKIKLVISKRHVALLIREYLTEDEEKTREKIWHLTDEEYESLEVVASPGKLKLYEQIELGVTKIAGSKQKCPFGRF